MNIDKNMAYLCPLPDIMNMDNKYDYDFDIHDAIVIISCYRKPYDKESINILEQFLNKIRPKKVIILSIVDTKKPTSLIKSHLGTKDLQSFTHQLQDDQVIRIKKYKEMIVSVCKKMDIPYEEITRKGRASSIIREEVNTYQPSLLVIHRTDKLRIEKALLGSTQEEVCKAISCRVVLL